MSLFAWFNSLSAEINNLNFHPLEVVSRYRDPQLQAGENCSYLYNLKQNICQSNIFKARFSFKLSGFKVK